MALPLNPLEQLIPLVQQLKPNQSTFSCGFLKTSCSGKQLFNASKNSFQIPTWWGISSIHMWIFEIYYYPNFPDSPISLSPMFHPLDHNTLAATVEGHHSEIQRLFLPEAVFRQTFSPKENYHRSLWQSTVQSKNVFPTLAIHKVCNIFCCKVFWHLYHPSVPDCRAEIFQTYMTSSLTMGHHLFFSQWCCRALFLVLLRWQLKF